MPFPLPSESLSGLPVSRSHRWTVLSSPPVARAFPSGEKATAPTQPFDPRKVARASPLKTSQIRTEPSVPPVASDLPSGEKEAAAFGPDGGTLAARTDPVGPLSLALAVREPVSQRMVEPSSPAEAS